ncbi:MAG: ImmA/IrrE family metallo-endopeptidase [Gemmataceae bacterium]|nr:ImmA/IrrE family metallo-endopeptidase [Gemmataceae bacterium]
MEDLLRDDVTLTVDRMIDDLLDAARIVQPPVDCIALAQGHLGMVVCLDRRQTARGRAQRAAGKMQIYLRPEPTEERHQWTVAHEIGEHLKPELLQQLGIEPTEAKAMAGESLANLFAYRLLVPTQWFAADARRMDFDLLALKQRYSTSSHEVLAWRWLDLPEPCVVTILDNGVIHRRRSNAWPTKRELNAAEAKCRQRVHDRGEPHVVRAGEWSVQGWPVHANGWKREVLRSVRDDGFEVMPR